MLILGRRINQTIVFPNCGITVRLLDCNGRVVKVGIEAPREIEVMRGELKEAIASVAGMPASPSASSMSYKPKDAPELEKPEPLLLQFAQRLAEVKSALIRFQQLRTEGNQQAADLLLSQLLNDIGHIDRDWLLDQSQTHQIHELSHSQAVSEPIACYETNQSKFPIHILLVNEFGKSESGLNFPVGCFHGCQICTVTSLSMAMGAIRSREPFDYIVCNHSDLSFDELELVRLIRAENRLDGSKLFMACNAADIMEYLELSETYQIDGWLSRPLTMHDLWNHIVECEQLEA